MLDSLSAITVGCTVVGYKCFHCLPSLSNSSMPELHFCLYIRNAAYFSNDSQTCHVNKLAVPHIEIAERFLLGIHFFAFVYISFTCTCMLDVAF